MTPQANFMVLAPIDQGGEEELCAAPRIDERPARAVEREQPADSLRSVRCTSFRAIAHPEGQLG